MLGKIKLVTAPDIVHDQAYTILVVCPDEIVKNGLQQYLSSRIDDCVVYIYNGDEKDIKWLLTTAKLSDVVLIDIDNSTEDVSHFFSYLLTLPATYYKCEHMRAQWDVINKNRFYDFPKLDEEL